VLKLPLVVLLGGRLNVPDNITLMPLPPYAPELNPVENIWEFLRGNLLSHRVWESVADISDACCDAWNKLIQTPERITSIATRSWATRHNFRRLVLRGSRKAGK
jgi:hypothetical protein